jgi:nucleotide-binding universal stress UspA family protein
LEEEVLSKTFLVAIDGSQQGWKALDLAATLAKVSDAALVLVHAAPFVPLSGGLKTWVEEELVASGDLREQLRYNRALGDKITADGEARVHKHGLDQVSSRVVEGNVAEEIAKLAEHTNADMLFVGSRGLSDLKGLLLGSISHKLAHLAPCSCVVVR